MNLHIVPDNTFINKFYDNLEELQLTQLNKVIVRTNNKKLSAIKHDLQFAPLYSRRFNELVGDTEQYDKVFIHYFTPLLYRWVTTHRFNQLSWAVWGGDLYNLPGLDQFCYEPLTSKFFVKRNFSVERILYELKVWMFHSRHQKKAMSKVKDILTWMTEEHKFAGQNLHVSANHKFFFYENQFPYEALDSLNKVTPDGRRPTLVIGNSGSPTNNHLDTIEFLNTHKINADLLIPVSYGDKSYIAFLKERLDFRYGKLEFIDRYMPFEEYLQMLAGTDGLVMNAIRPQGYGNILMMLYMNKPVFFNDKNISLRDLTNQGLKWRLLKELGAFEVGETDVNKEAVKKLLSHERLGSAYRQLFG